MANFNVLEYNQWYMSKIGFYSYHLTRPTNDLFRSFASYYILFFSIIFTISSSAAFAIIHASQFSLALETSFILIAGIQTTGVFLSIGLKMKKVKILHLKLQEIVDQGKRIYFFMDNSYSKRFLPNQLKERWPKSIGKLNRNAENIRQKCFITFMYIKQCFCLIFCLQFIMYRSEILMYQRGNYHFILLFHLMNLVFGDGVWNGSFNLIWHLVMDIVWYQQLRTFYVPVFM